MSASRRGSPLVFLLSSLVALQGAALVGVATFTVVEVLLARGSAPEAGARVIAVSVAGIAVIVGVGLLLAARGLHGQRRWARAPAFVVQLIIGLVAVGPGGVWSAGFWYVALPLLLWAVVVTVLLFLPATSLVDE